MHAVAAFFASIITFVSGLFAPPLASHSPVNIPATQPAAAAAAQTEIAGNPFTDPAAASAVAATIPATAPAPAFSSPPAQTVINQPVIERVIERIVSQGDSRISADTLAAILADFGQSIETRIAALNPPKADIPQQVAAAGNSASYYFAPASQRIDQLSNTAINTPTITGGAISGASSVGASSGSFDALSAGTLALSGAITGTDASFSGTLSAGILNVAGLSSQGALIGPYFTATSTTATSSFAGGLTAANGGFSILQNGNVGIGTASPTNLLTVAGASSFVARFNHTGSVSGGGNGAIVLGDPATPANGTGIYLRTNGEASISTAASGYLTFYPNQTEAMRITSAGNVGIGTTTPGALLSANGNILGAGTLALTGTTGTTTIASGQGFTIGGSQFVVQQGSGNVGIGTASPAHALDVLGNIRMGTGATNAILRVANITDSSGTSNLYLERNDGTLLGYLQAYGPSHGQSVAGVSTNNLTLLGSAGGLMLYPTGALHLATAGTERMRIDTSGNVGIGTTTPWGRLSIKGAGTGAGLAFAVADSANTPRFVIQDNGNVGIGTTTPANVLTVAGGANFYPLKLDSTTSGTGFQISNSGIVNWNLWGNGAAFQIHDGTHGIVNVFKGAPTDSFKIAGNGDVSLGTNTGFFTNGGTATGTIIRLRDRVFIDDGALFGGELSSPTGLGATTTTLHAWGPRDSSLYVDSSDGRMAIVGSAVRSKSNDGLLPSGVASIGVSGFGVNDDVDGTSGGTWGGYFDAVRYPGAGFTVGAEITMANMGNETIMTPFNVKGAGASGGVSVWVASGAGLDVGAPSAGPVNDIAAYMAFLSSFADNSAKARRGIVFQDASVEETSPGSLLYDGLVWNTGYRVRWSRNNAGTEELAGYITSTSTTPGVAAVGINMRGSDILFDAPSIVVQAPGGGNVKAGALTDSLAYGAITLNGTLNAASANFYSNTTDKNLYINRPTGSDISFTESNGSPQLTIDTGGNIGIGTTSPASLLSVGGSGYMTGGLGIGSNANSSGLFVANTLFSGALTTQGIALGTSGGYAAQEMYGASGTLLDWSAASGHSYDFRQIYTASTNDLQVVSSSTANILTLKASGNVGIGTTTPTAQLSTTGTVRFAGLGSGGANLVTDALGNVTASSDERLKDKQGDFTRGLAAINAISPVLYKWRPETGLDTQSTYAGFFAQNVQAAIPEAVSPDSRGYLTLADRPILAALVNAVKELATKLDTFAERFTTKQLTFVRGEADDLTLNQRLCIKNSVGTPVCVTGDQLAALLGQTGAAAAPASAIPSAPVIELNGNASSTIEIGDTYNDLGARILAPEADLNLGLVIVLDGATTSAVSIDTTTPGEHTIIYTVTSPTTGLTGSIMRTVVVSPSAQSPEPPSPEPANDNPFNANDNASSTSVLIVESTASI